MYVLKSSVCSSDVGKLRDFCFNNEGLDTKARVRDNVEKLNCIAYM